MAHWLFLPDDALHDLVILAALTPDQFEKLRGHLDSHEFRLQYRFYIKVADLLQISDEAAAKLSVFLNHVHTQRVRAKREAESIPTELEHFLGRIQTGENGQLAKGLIGQIRSKKDYIVKLFSDLPKRDFSDKVRDLETGPIPHLHSFRTVCDVRPVFNKEATEITSHLLVITLNMVTHTTVSNDYEEVVVQLAEEDLKEIRTAFERLEKKMVLLKQHHRIGSELRKREG
ncbi:hypothetical protein VT84_37570 [Gemmata sp. SH-PL17]|uniref:hypothetical protein n=1 Tax=Gemmata sp. SH-PL17 TaxID=1630693 RepID=UPI00078C9BF8|nr:hypothetical protein [Gemmata sp. SH-PL17]AMV30163.1 hypothetical protein VT84_37570 [Gemmata sp. SH-PL17]